MRPSIVHRSVAASGAVVSVLWLVALGLVATGAILAGVAVLLVVTMVRHAIARFVRRLVGRDPPPPLIVVRATVLAPEMRPAAALAVPEVLP
jgi:hypothetical protein